MRVCRLLKHLMKVFERMKMVRGESRCGLKIYAQEFGNAMTLTVVEAIARSLLLLLVVNGIRNR